MDGRGVETETWSGVLSGSECALINIGEAEHTL